jgi:hypothetical protein
MVIENMQSISLKIYVGEELAQELKVIIDENHFDPNPLGIALQNGMTSHIHYDDIFNIPTKGMIYSNGMFIDGPNGETFRIHSPARDIDYDLFVFLKDNVVLDFWLVPSKHPIFEATIAILDSNPTFEIV